MNRPIKFRAWQKSGNLMRSVQNISFSAAQITTGDQEYPSRESVLKFNEIVLEQFTGFLDKHGKEIYEGDIVLADDGGEYFPQELNQKTDEYEPTGKYEVYWAAHAAWWLRSEKDDDNLEYSPFSPGITTFEVIGDIHNNPELLK